MWFKKISIPPQQRELKISKGRGGQRPRKFQRAGELCDRFSFQGSFDSMGHSIFYLQPPIEGPGFLRGSGESLKAVSVGVTVSAPLIFE